MTRAHRCSFRILLAILVALIVASRSSAQVDGMRTVQFETSEVTAPDVAVSLDGEWLIFTLLGKLFRLPAAGGDAEQLTFGPSYDRGPAISPDGKSVAFQSDRDGTDGNIFVLTLASREIKQVTHEIWTDRPAWAPDGKSLVYLRLERKAWADQNSSRPPALVRWVSLAGGEPKTLRAQGAIWSAFYLPDGRLSWTLVEGDTRSGRVTTRLQVRDRSGRVSSLRLFDGVADPVVPSPKADGFYARSDVALYNNHVLIPYFTEGTVLFAPLAGGTEQRIYPVSGERGGFAVAVNNATMYLGNLGHLWKVRLPAGQRQAIAFRAKVTLAIRQPTAPPQWTPVEPGTTVRPRTIRQPRLSPDGSHVVFRAFGGQLWEQAIDGTPARRLVDGDGLAFDPAFSPDGRQLAFVRDAPGKREIQVLEFASGKTRTLGGQSACAYTDLSWSAHGELVVALGGSCHHQVIAIDPGTGTRRVLAETSDWEPYPELSAFGQTLYFQAEFAGSAPGFYRKQLNAAGRPERLLPATGDGADIATNGRWVARAVPNRLGVWLAPLASNGVTQTAAREVGAADGDEFSLTPDGSALLYVAGDKLWREPLGGGTREQIAIHLEVRTPTPPPMLIERVRVLDFAKGGFGAETSLMLENGRIQWIGTAPRALPPGTVTVDAGGRYAIPGLFDMHGHGGGCGGTALIAYGVTSVRNMGGNLTGQNAHADRGDATGDAIPRCFYAGRILEGPQGYGRGNLFVYATDEEDVRMYVRRWHAQGAQFIKLYERLPWPLQRAAADEARRLALPVVAHGNALEQVVKGVTLGYAGLTHWPHVHDDVLQMLAAAGTRWDPTLMPGIELFSRDDPERFPRVPQVLPQVLDITLRGFWAERLRNVRLAYSRGITFMPGTDTGPGGLALQWELEFFAEAGIPPLDILRLDTQVSAQTLGAQDQLGAIEAGKLADLVLLDANPLEDIKNTRSIWRVIKGGWVFDPKVLRPSGN